MDGANQNQQWSINQPQQSQINQRPNWNNPVIPPVMMPQNGSPQWWQMMFNPNMMNAMQMAAQQAQQQAAQQNPMVQPQQPTQNAAPAVMQTMNQISSARVITSTEDIKPSEVPVDDTVRLFLTDDLQTIYGKKWDNNGELKNMVFQRVPDEPVEVVEATDSKISEEMLKQGDRITALEDRIDALLNATTELSNKITKIELNGSKSTSTKKGGATNE